MFLEIARSYTAARPFGVRGKYTSGNEMGHEEPAGSTAVSADNVVTGDGMDQVGSDRLQTELRAKGVARILISEEELQAEIRAMATELDAEYGSDQPLMIGVLTGAVAFMADLMKAMTIPLEIDFMAISSYGAATKSSGVVRILKDLNADIEGRRLIIVEDIVDSGLTLQYLLELLKARAPQDIRVVALLKKDKPDAIDVQADRVGFHIPDEFVVGYGLDYAGRYRNLPYVAVLDPSEYSGA